MSDPVFKFTLSRRAYDTYAGRYLDGKGPEVVLYASTTAEAYTRADAMSPEPRRGVVWRWDTVSAEELLPAPAPADEPAPAPGALYDAKLKAGALRMFADGLEEVPDYSPSDYDRGRVDQRHQMAMELYEAADQLEAEASE